jgi:hypothetical protein
MRYSPEIQVRHRAGNGLAFDDNVMKQAQIDVYQKALLTLPVTEPQAELLGDKTEELQARLCMETARQALRQGRFAEALAAARQANRSRSSTKLKMVVVGLRFFPNLLRSAYCVYEQFLESRRNRRLVRFRASLNEAAGTVRK